MKALPSPAVLWETLRHLRARQVGYQLAKRLIPSGHPAPLSLRWRQLSPRVPPEKRTSRHYLNDGDTFCFNNEARKFSGHWNDPKARKLWLYNLHYMAWLFDLKEEREAWILKWIRENPVGFGNGWEPYPLSLRLFNWCKLFSATGQNPNTEMIASMEKQASWLLANLEFHLDGNHLLENLLSLAFIGFFLDANDSKSVRARQRIQTYLDDALSDQFLADGGHYELSPMYHAILLERMLDLLNFWPTDSDGFSDPFPGLQTKLQALALSGLDWLETMSVGGQFALFNDACYDAAPEAGLLLDYGARLFKRSSPQRTSLRVLKDSGYYRAEAGMATVIFDAGALGPDHQMGHAQGDMLSFCLWLRDTPVLVHPGNYEYISGVMRDYCRSTSSHNTLLIEGAEQADWWASHRVGWRGRPRHAEATVDAKINAPTPRVRLSGSHDGYRRLPGHPLHERLLELTAQELTVSDRLTAAPGRPCAARFHFHPDCVVKREGEAFIVAFSCGAMRIESDSPISVGEGWYCPEFGLRFKNTVLSVAGDWSGFKTTFTFLN